jgi:hypothetical protein
VRALALALVTLAACNRGPTPVHSIPASAPIASPALSAATGLASDLDAYVTDERGPVAGVEISLVALPDGSCPCATPFDTSGFGNEMPECACPEALSKWKTRLAACQWPAQAVRTAATDARGHVALTRPAGVTGIEVARQDGVRWLPWPTTAGPIGLELATSISPRVTFPGTTGVAVHGAFLFDDGHCVPLERHGDVWGPRVPLPRFEISPGTLVIEAVGYATIVYSLFDQEEIEIELHHDRVATGTCEDGGTARLDNPFQHLVAKLDAKKQFTFKGALDVTSKVSCWADATDMTDEWDFTLEDGISDANVYGGIIGGSCTDVKVIDAANQPVAGAEVSALHDMGGGMGTGTINVTNEHGIACIEDLDAGIDLTVRPPAAVGGQCAGTVEVNLTQHQLAKPPLVVRLHIAKLPMARPRGRIVSAEGTPVAGAYVSVRNIEPSATPDCSDRGDESVTTTVDGTFTLPTHPRGTLTLDVQHDWYAEQELTIKNDGTPHDIVLQRGGRWTGRILDPEGTLVDACQLFLTLKGGRLLSTKCNKTGFSFGTLTPGEADVQVRVQDHPLGTFRTLRKKLHLDGNALALDIAFPKGEHISGRVVDSKGNAVATARVFALPKGMVSGGQRIPDDEVQLLTDAAGHFKLLHLKPGMWTLRAHDRRGSEAKLDIATGSKDVELVIPDPPPRR